MRAFAHNAAAVIPSCLIAFAPAFAGYWPGLFASIPLGIGMGWMTWKTWVKNK